MTKNTNNTADTKNTADSTVAKAAPSPIVLPDRTLHFPDSLLDTVAQTQIPSQYRTYVVGNYAGPIDPARDGVYMIMSQVAGAKLAAQSVAAKLGIGSAYVSQDKAAVGPKDKVQARQTRVMVVTGRIECFDLN